jgi:hypothetical protein
LRIVILNEFFVLLFDLFKKIIKIDLRVIFQITNIHILLITVKIMVIITILEGVRTMHAP